MPHVDPGTSLIRHFPPQWTARPEAGLGSGWVVRGISAVPRITEVTAWLEATYGWSNLRTRLGFAPGSCGSHMTLEFRYAGQRNGSSSWSTPGWSGWAASTLNGAPRVTVNSGLQEGDVGRVGVEARCKTAYATSTGHAYATSSWQARQISVMPTSSSYWVNQTNGQVNATMRSFSTCPGSTQIGWRVQGSYGWSGWFFGSAQQTAWNIGWVNPGSTGWGNFQLLCRRDTGIAGIGVLDGPIRTYSASVYRPVPAPSAPSGVWANGGLVWRCEAIGGGWQINASWGTASYASGYRYWADGTGTYTTTRTSGTVNGSGRPAGANFYVQAYNGTGYGSTVSVYAPRRGPDLC